MIFAAIFFVMTVQPLESPTPLQQMLGEIHERHFMPIDAIRKLLNRYSDEEIDRIYKDFVEIRRQTFLNARKERVYVVTAGGPGAGKSTHLETTLEFERDDSPNRLVRDTKSYAYVDPDRRALFFMTHTFKRDIDAGKSPTDAYNYWRDASNFIANTLLALALKDGYAIAHGTTMTAPPAILQKLMSTIHEVYNYTIQMHHITAPDDVRVESIKNRERLGIVQSTEQDVRDKGKWLFERLPIYLEHVDTLIFYYRGDMTQVTKAAVKTKAGLEVMDEAAFQKIKELHGTFWSL